ncbi:response regulator transcription factor [Micromonospora sp. 15K316]|uniref:response regulator transcription factor n=1 Tax=Micromonospora sp. 15K316 TaxID=2530376 RepID=UPI0021106744|nr:LuxR C-terminal-related transcriptional regulator [Micromonospora sp. 15K316]
MTARELEVPRAAADGAPVGEIAAAVHLVPGTMRNYLSAAMPTLGAPTRYAAARTGSEQGWI